MKFAYSRHCLRAVMQGFKPLSINKFTQLAWELA